MDKSKNKDNQSTSIVVFIDEIVWNHEGLYRMIRLQAANLAQMNLTVIYSRNILILHSGWVTCYA